MRSSTLIEPAFGVFARVHWIWVLVKVGAGKVAQVTPLKFNVTPVVGKAVPVTVRTFVEGI